MGFRLARVARYRGSDRRTQDSYAPTNDELGLGCKRRLLGNEKRQAPSNDTDAAGPQDVSDRCDHGHSLAHIGKEH